HEGSVLDDIPARHHARTADSSRLGLDDEEAEEVSAAPLRSVIAHDSRNVHQVWPVPAEGVELDTVGGIAARVRAGAVRLEKRGRVRRRIYEHHCDGPVRVNIAVRADGKPPGQA